jgi:hypothetical protein
MANTQRNFIKGRMNKSLDERLLPNGEYVDALNVRLGSTEDSEIGSVENTKGNEALTVIGFDGTNLSANARCIGAFEEGEDETLFWFVHDPSFSVGATAKLDLIMSYNTNTDVLTYHVISIDDGGGTNTTLNFDEKNLITGINKVDDLLFFTDDRNPPRFINVTRSYDAPVTNIDQFTAEELLVIKKPPINSPAIASLTSTSENNYLEDRFVSFAYRYKYADNEYSATSQFSNPSFIPKAFDFDTQSFLNEGMVNSTNVCDITYNSGGELVVGVDLLFKDMNTGTIKVIEKLDKSEIGLADNTDYTYTFSNSKIFTVLADSEILRLFDNVPKLAKAQTLMGNRLMYGNYLEQYDLTDLNGNAVKLEYDTSLFTQDVGDVNLTGSSITSGTYTVNGTVVPTACVAQIDLSGVELKAQAQLSISFSIEHDTTASGTGAPFNSATTPVTSINFDYVLQQDFASPFDLAQDPNFIRRIGELVLKSVGSNTSVTANKLVDSGANFVSNGVEIGDFVTNNVSNQQAAVTAVANTELTLDADIFTAFPRSYSVYDASSIRDVSQACNGLTLSDELNCASTSTLSTFTKASSGIDTLPEPVKIISSPTSNIIGLQILAMKYEDGASSAFEYYTISNLSATYRALGNPKSLHSNRGYEIGIIYMDDFNRSSTALVSENNTEHVPCGNSDLTNRIKVTIPVQQLAPSWATRYKFCIKANKDTYETIYTNLFFDDVVAGAKWFILEGENSRKVEVGDELIVKTDTSGSLNRCEIATVLDKEAKQADFISPKPTDAAGRELDVPAGVYMKMRANNFSTQRPELPLVSPGKVSKCEKGRRFFPRVSTPIASVDNPNVGSSPYSPTTAPFITYTIPAGSRIRIKADFLRKGSGSACEKRFGPDLDLELTATQDYSTFVDWWIGDGVAALLNNGPKGTDNPSECDPENVFLPTILLTSLGQGPNDVPGDNCKNHWQFLENDTNTSPNYGSVSLIVTGARSCGSLPKRRACVDLKISVLRADNFLVFETQPQDALPDVWYESSTSYQIDTATGFHTGNEQTQTASQPAIVLTEFFNCFAFGNGVESYKIKDSIIGKPLEIGNRTTTTSAEDYREIRRFADITYSGVYNDESNVNKLNEFNLGLLNFKALEDVYGPITLLDGRETDILTLQEDKISYVLTGKNLLSDSTGGGTVSSVPEVLGTQIARIEDYGNSNNPESYAKWGANKFFTDAKRGAVIQLKGSSAQNEQLTVISEMGMRSYFRDLFIQDFDTQKLGGYDPYMNEYVLSGNTVKLPSEEECLNCFFRKVFTVKNKVGTQTFCVNLTELVGTVTVTYNVTNVTGTSTIQSTYDGVTTSSGAVAGGTASYTFNKNKVGVTKAFFTLSATEESTIDLKVTCPDALQMSLIQICISSDDDSGELIHNEYRWDDTSYVSPLHSNQVTLGSGTGLVISQYLRIPTPTTLNPNPTTPQGGSIIPADGATVSVRSNRITASGDDFDFNTAQHELLFLRSNVPYAETVADINTLLTLATQITPVTGGPDLYQGSFTMPTSSDQYLYLIYDYRDKQQATLCYSAVGITDVCCNCT